jgi:hypothetical protein
MACSFHGILSTIGLENLKSKYLLRVNFVRSQLWFAIYSRLCSRNEEAFGEGTRARHADSSNEGGDALKTKCAFSRGGKTSFSEVPRLLTESKGILQKCRTGRQDLR